MREKTLKKIPRRLAALLMAAAMTLLLSPGRAALSGVYFTAANDQLMDLTADTMPFYSGGVLYVSSRLFEGLELGVSYARSTSMGLAILYTSNSSKDLLFDLAGQVTYDKENNFYSGYAIERSGVVFFPLDLVCRYFGLTWSYNETDIAPLIRVKSAGVILSDSDFIAAATSSMNLRYSEYERALTTRPPAVNPDPPSVTQPPVMAAEGQKIYLILRVDDASDALSALSALERVQATFLLTLEQFSDGDLVRALVSGGHAVALRAAAETEAAAEEEILLAQDALWRAACCRLELVWYDGPADLSALLPALGCVPVTAGLAWTAGLDRSGGETALLRAIGRYREDLAVYLGGCGDCLPALPAALSALTESRYRLSAWRLTA